jgi:hypothetical protein
VDAPAQVQDGRPPGFDLAGNLLGCRPSVAGDESYPETQDSFVDFAEEISCRFSQK